MLLYTVTWMSLKAVTARLPREMLREVERLAEKMKVDRSELISIYASIKNGNLIMYHKSIIRPSSRTWLYND